MAARVGPLTGKAQRAYRLAVAPNLSYPRPKLIMKGPGGDCSRPGLWPTTKRVADMTDRICTAPGCDNPRRGRQALCSKHYQQQWRQSQPCRWPGCSRPRTGKGLCGLHYHRQRTGADMEAPLPARGATCSLPDCDQPRNAYGLCGKHGQRLRRTGDPYGVRRVTTAECTITGCTAVHMANGLCHRHYEINRRHGAPEPVYACRVCGGPFDPSSGTAGVHGGSYVYCPPCAAEAPQAYSRRAGQRRLERLRANNAGMTGADQLEAALYRAIIIADPCVYCGDASDTIDHIMPVVDGGGDRWNNLAPACRRCNAIKHDRSLLTTMLARGGPR